jgi:hypothetical protein
MEPTKKSQGIEDFIKQVMGKDRQETIRNGKCMTCDVDEVGGFKDELSAKEYTISGMCQACQDKAFGEV